MLLNGFISHGTWFCLCLVNLLVRDGALSRCHLKYLMKIARYRSSIPCSHGSRGQPLDSPPCFSGCLQRLEVFATDDGFAHHGTAGWWPRVRGNLLDLRGGRDVQRLHMANTARTHRPQHPQATARTGHTTHRTHHAHQRGPTATTAHQQATPRTVSHGSQRLAQKALPLRTSTLHQCF